MYKFAKLSIVALLCIGAVFAYQRWFHTQKSVSAVVDLPCADLTMGCGIAGMQIKADHAPHVMRAFHLNVAATADSVYVDFAMAGMSMGLNRYRLIQQTDGGWQGEIILPVCVQGRSDWLMEITANTATEEKRYHLAFNATK